MVEKPYLVSEDRIKVPRFSEEAGFYTTKKRSKIMGKIKAKNTKPEVLLRKALWKLNVRYRIHQKNIFGTPDLVIKKYRLAIFVDGSFWHGYDWGKRKEQWKKNKAFWVPKIERNIQRDLEVNKKLEDAGFTVMRFWDFEIEKNLNHCINQIMLYIEAAKEHNIPALE
ncbi:very short patch repair endonuclease [Pedobacter sp. SD-b]|uniref:Very short patch repair endonuclease n=1 Tax=Pedobacter segetis TaxID=2793069 RepID=A0ABS1BK90_9SPHI|nr:very short patch repair endonuclease [Pedobacter segetis]MBK0383282.1 very short patch repair endonuclease [Pedobacter segetis]